MSYGTSDTTVISSTKTEDHNFNTIDASAASRDDISPATIPTITPENRRLWNVLDRFPCSKYINHYPMELTFNGLYSDP